MDGTDERAERHRNKAGSQRRQGSDLADMLRGERELVILDMYRPEDREAAEKFVQMLYEQQGNIRVFSKKNFQ